MRTIEACTLRWSDLNFDEIPTRVNIREEYTKTKQGRYSYISDEAARFLKEWKQWKYRERSFETDDLIFPFSNETSVSHIYKRLWIEFNKILTVVNKDKRKDNSRRRKITLNSFRRFAKTTLADAVNSDYSEYLIGHADSSYWSKKEDEVREIYKTKCMKYLTFLDYATFEATGKNIEAKLEEKDSEMQAMKMKYEQDMKVMRDEMNQQFNQIMSMIQQNPKLAQLKPDVLPNKKMIPPSC